VGTVRQAPSRNTRAQRLKRFRGAATEARIKLPGNHHQAHHLLIAKGEMVH
jgi:hypothetical protein